MLKVYKVRLRYFHVASEGRISFGYGLVFITEGIIEPTKMKILKKVKKYKNILFPIFNS